MHNPKRNYTSTIDDPHKLDLEERQSLAELNELSELVAGRRKSWGMNYYVPNKKQLVAHQSDARTICYVGGNRAGKSTFGVMELCFHLTRKYPDWFSDKRRFKVPVRAVISATEYSIVDRVIEPKIRQYLPSDYYRVQRVSGKYLSKLICIDGSTVDILTLEMKDEAYESADWDFAWEDEPQTRRKRDGIKRGLLDRNGLEVITFTPLTEPWMKEELIDKADGKRIDVITVDTYDNCETVDGTKILSKDAIEELELSYTEDVRETRIHGKFFHLRGQVYKEFNSEHTTHFEYEYPNPVICILDPHDRQPHHIIWAFIDRNDDIFVDYELSIHCELDDLSRRIRAVEEVRNYKMRKRLIDPNFGRKPYKTGSNESVIQELSKHKCSFYEANDNIELGHMLVRDYLHCNWKAPITAFNKPKLFFSKTRCQKTIRSMNNLQYDEWMGKTKSEKDPKEEEKPYETHGADCIRYLCIGKPRYKGLISYGSNAELSASPY